MNESEYRAMCDHLGHTYDVHKRYYRLHDITVALTKVGKVLETDFRSVEENKDDDGKKKKRKSKSYVYRLLLCHTDIE